MTPDPPTLEAELRELKVIALDDSFLTRLEASAAGTWAEPTGQEIRFEKSLRGFQIAKLDAAFLAELETIVRDVPFALDEKIVPFVKAAPTAPARRKYSFGAAAAAIAMIGAATALLMPGGKAPQNAPRQVASSHSAPITGAAANHFVPASFNRGLSEVRDEGVIWKSNNQPHRIVRVVYKDQVTLKDAQGRTVEVEQPRVEYMLVPAKTD